MIDQRSGIVLMDKVDARWEQSFVDRFRIVRRAHTGKQVLSPSKPKEFDKEVVRVIGYMYSLCSSEAANEDDAECGYGT